ncbi:MAG: glutamyl-tRNA reductase, partial [Nocardioidaceae bacterium]
VISTELIARAMAARLAETPEAPLVIIDLALPHDVEPSAADLPQVTLISLKSLADSVNNGSARVAAEMIKSIVAEEVAAYAAARDAARVAPTVVALRSMATAVVATELERLWGRLDDLTPEQEAEITHSVRRVADKLLHEPTVRVKQFAGRAPQSSYAAALAELFALDPAAVEAVTRVGDAT